MRHRSVRAILWAAVVFFPIGCGSDDDGGKDLTGADGSPSEVTNAPEGGDESPGFDGGSIEGDAKADGSARTDAITDARSVSNSSDVVVGSGDVVTACAAYADAYCTRYEACMPFGFHTDFGNLESCKGRTAQFCPNEFTAPGTAITVSGLSTCARTLSALTCPEWLADPIPVTACAWRGTLSNASSCEYGSQCQSGFCSKAALDSWCGVCRPKFVLGEACDRRQRSCDTGLVCADSCLPDDAGTCTQQRTFRCVRPAPEGSPCESINACERGLICSNGSCAKAKQVGEPCGLLDCDIGKSLYCVPNATTQAGVCSPVTYSGTNQACNFATPVICSGWGTCFANGAPAQSGTCRAPVADGQACDPNSACLAPAICSAGTCQGPGPAATCR